MSLENKTDNNAETVKSQNKDKLSSLEIQFNKLKSRDFRYRNDAIKELGRMKEDEARQKLFDIAKSKDWDERLRVLALESLGRRKRGHELQKLLQDLANEDNQKREIRRTCLTQLSRYKDPKLISTFANALSDDYRFIRFWAVRGLIKIQNIKSVSALVKALGDPDEEIRKEVNTHIEREGEMAIPALIKAYNSEDANDFLKYGVIGLLGRTNSSESLDTLIKALSDDDERVVTLAIRALGKLNNPDAITPLIKLYATNEKKRRSIQSALFRIGQDSLENEKILIYLLASLLLEKDQIFPTLAVSLFSKFPNSYIILGEISHDPEIDENFKLKINEVIENLS